MTFFFFLVSWLRGSDRVDVCVRVLAQNRNAGTTFYKNGKSVVWLFLCSGEFTVNVFFFLWSGIIAPHTNADCRWYKSCGLSFRWNYNRESRWLLKSTQLALSFWIPEKSLSGFVNLKIRFFFLSFYQLLFHWYFVRIWNFFPVFLSRRINQTDTQNRISSDSVCVESVCRPTGGWPTALGGACSGTQKNFHLYAISWNRIYTRALRGLRDSLSIVFLGYVLLLGGTFFLFFSFFFLWWAEQNLFLTDCHFCFLVSTDFFFILFRRFQHFAYSKLRFCFFNRFFLSGIGDLIGHWINQFVPKIVHLTGKIFRLISTIYFESDFFLVDKQTNTRNSVIDEKSR